MTTSVVQSVNHSEASIDISVNQMLAHTAADYDSLHSILLQKIHWLESERKSLTQIIGELLSKNQALRDVALINGSFFERIAED
jgi:hypothetical protein